MPENLTDNLEFYAQRFQALGAEARLRIFIVLLQYNPHGLNVKDLQEKVQMKPSTLAHHLKALVQAGFVSQIQKGKESINIAHLDPLLFLCSDIYHQCCVATSKAHERRDFSDLFKQKQDVSHKFCSCSVKSDLKVEQDRAQDQVESNK